jgi:hypothetical protein
MVKETQHHVDNDDDGDGDKWNMWNFLPHAITAAIAVAGVVMSLLWQLSDLKVRDMEMGTKIVYLESRVQHIEDTLGNRANISDGDRKDLWDQVEDIKGTLKNIEEQHNRSGMNHR